MERSKEKAERNYLRPKSDQQNPNIDMPSAMVPEVTRAAGTERLR